MEFHEKLDRPHVLYRIFTGETLLYIGMSNNALSRIKNHVYSRDWAQRMTTITLEWYPGYYEAARAEAAAILAENPQYNRTKFPLASIGAAQRRRLNPSSRGDGYHCPKCGLPKTRRRDAYCKSCVKKYRHDRLRVEGWLPREERPPVPCPRCGGVRQPKQAYCKPCRGLVAKEYYKKRKAQAAAS